MKDRGIMGLRVPERGGTRTHREFIEEQIDAVVGELVAHMREQLQRAEMDDSDAAVREACRRRLRARLALCESPDSPPS